MSSFIFVEGDLTINKHTWRHHTWSRFSLSKVIRISMRIPEDVIHILLSLCWRWFEYQWKYLTMSYTSSFLSLEGDSDIDENTWWHHTGIHFSLSKVIQILKRIPEDIILIFISLYRRWFEYRWEYLNTSYIYSFLLIAGSSNVKGKTLIHHTCTCISKLKVVRMSMRIPEYIIHILISLYRG